MDRRSERIVITGIGLVTPCGIGVKQVWPSLLEGKSGIGPISAFDASTFNVRIAGQISNWDPLPFVEKKKLKEMDRFIEFSLGASKLAIEDAVLDLTDEEREEAACVVGVGIGGLATIERVASVLREKGAAKVSPYSIPSIIANMAAGQVGIANGLRGMSMCTTNACASGASAIGEAAEMIRSGRASVAIAGGAEAAITPIGISGFQAMFALSRRNDDPQRACRPFDLDRDGFVCSEGAAMLVLEPLTRARKRGARIYAELTGYGSSSDAYHMVQPPPDGRGARASMSRAIRHAGVNSDDIDYVNAHGTATVQGDIHECQAILSVFREHAANGRVWVSSTKSMTGHLLGAAGALEASVCALACATGQVPPTINVDHQDPECRVDVVPNSARERGVRHALSNSFGFGGSNVSLVLSRLV